uniref:GP3 protein n=1 Tax=Free State vervet virus TaxID=1737586 RepID=A0A159D7F1_9NIDO|nr:GP3 protein [Free State vervet virus]
MGRLSVSALLSLSSLLCGVHSYCFVFPDPDIHIQVFLNYTTCHMQGNITAGYQSLGDCHSFAHNEFSGAYNPLNLNYSTAAPIGAVVLGLQLLAHHHINCSWNNHSYCCSSYSAQLRSEVAQPLPHLVVLGTGAILIGIMSVCLAAPRRSPIKLA